MQIACTETAPPLNKAAPLYPPLAQETRSHVDTACAAYHLNRKPRTLRAWATGELAGPIQPSSRICGRLSWAVADLQRLLSHGGAA